MGVVNLARVDERLIHGQVMMTLSQKSGVNSIFVVDEVVAKDKFYAGSLQECRQSDRSENDCDHTGKSEVLLG
jgi:mannose/fructose/N-acetylgalactosamine-specific phosphotransferase system component IIB